MKCLFVSDSGRITLSQKKEPRIKKGWAKIKIKSAGLCGSDIAKIRSDKKARLSINKQIWGHEFSGVIQEIHTTEHLKVGDRVAVQPIIFDNTNEITNAKSLGKELDGGFAEYALVPVPNLLKIPSTLPFELASLTEVVAVCIHARDFASITKKSKILIIGDGTLGLTLTLVLKSISQEVYLQGKNKKNLSLATSLGIKLLDKKKKNNNQFDVIFETVGRAQDQTLADAIAYVAPKGKIIVLGVFNKDYVNKIMLRNLFFKEAIILGSNCYDGMVDFRRALHLLKKYRTYFSKLITHKVSFEECSQVLNILENKNNELVVKILLCPEKSV
jgi:threonine dehydrogenase-like Zn-dependent dehydrogenase